MKTVGELIEEYGYALEGMTGLFYDATSTVRRWRFFLIKNAFFDGFTGFILDQFPPEPVHLINKVLFYLMPGFGLNRLKSLVIQYGWAKGKR